MLSHIPISEGEIRDVLEKLGGASNQDLTKVEFVNTAATDCDVEDTYNLIIPVDQPHGGSIGECCCLRPTEA